MKKIKVSELTEEKIWVDSPSGSVYFTIDHDGIGSYWNVNWAISCYMGGAGNYVYPDHELGIWKQDEKNRIYEYHLTGGYGFEMDIDWRSCIWKCKSSMFDAGYDGNINYRKIKRKKLRKYDKKKDELLYMVYMSKDGEVNYCKRYKVQTGMGSECLDGRIRRYNFKRIKRRVWKVNVQCWAEGKDKAIEIVKEFNNKLIKYGRWNSIEILEDQLDFCKKEKRERRNNE